MNTRRGLLAVGVLLLVAVVIIWRWQHTLESRAEGIRLAASGRFADAEPLLLAAYGSDSADAEVAAALTRTKLAGPDPASAEPYLSRWCDLRPDDPEPFRVRMDLRHRTVRGKWGQVDKLRVMEGALADGRRVLQLDPSADAVRREVAWLLLQTGRTSEAESELRTCIATAPRDVWVSYLLAKCLHAQGKRPEAEALLDPVVKAQPKFAEALLLRGILHREADQPDKAVTVLRQAVTLPNISVSKREGLYQLGLALAATGQVDEARTVMAEVDLLTLQGELANDHFPETPAMRVQIAEAMLGAGQLDDARKKLEGVLAELSDFTPAHRAMAAYYERTGQPDRAADHRRRAGKDAR